MTSTALATPARRPKPLTPTRRVKTAIAAMVFDGADRKAAAAAAGMTDHSLREALRKPHVLAYLREQKEVLRTSAGAAALRTIATLATEAKAERVKLDAAKYLDGNEKQGGTSINVAVGVNVSTPGYVIDLSAPQPATLNDHDANALIEHDEVAGE